MKNLLDKISNSTILLFTGLFFGKPTVGSVSDMANLMMTVF